MSRPPSPTQCTPPSSPCPFRPAGPLQRRGLFGDPPPKPKGSGIFPRRSPSSPTLTRTEVPWESVEAAAQKEPSQQSRKRTSLQSYAQSHPGTIGSATGFEFPAGLKGQQGSPTGRGFGDRFQSAHTMDEPLAEPAPELEPMLHVGGRSPHKRQQVSSPLQPESEPHMSGTPPPGPLRGSPPQQLTYDAAIEKANRMFPAPAFRSLQGQQDSGLADGRSNAVANKRIRPGTNPRVGAPGDRGGGDGRPAPGSPATQPSPARQTRFGQEGGSRQQRQQPVGDTARHAGGSDPDVFERLHPKSKPRPVKQVAHAPQGDRFTFTPSGGFTDHGGGADAEGPGPGRARAPAGQAASAAGVQERPRWHTSGPSLLNDAGRERSLAGEQPVAPRGHGPGSAGAVDGIGPEQGPQQSRKTPAGSRRGQAGGGHSEHGGEAPEARLEGPERERRAGASGPRGGAPTERRRPEERLVDPEVNDSAAGQLPRFRRTRSSRREPDRFEQLRTSLAASSFPDPAAILALQAPTSRQPKDASTKAEAPAPGQGRAARSAPTPSAGGASGSGHGPAGNQPRGRAATASTALQGNGQALRPNSTSGQRGPSNSSGGPNHGPLVAARRDRAATSGAAEPSFTGAAGRRQGSPSSRATQAPLQQRQVSPTPLGHGPPAAGQSGHGSPMTASEPGPEPGYESPSAAEPGGNGRLAMQRGQAVSPSRNQQPLAASQRGQPAARRSAGQRPGSGGAPRSGSRPEAAPQDAIQLWAQRRFGDMAQAMTPAVMRGSPSKPGFTDSAVAQRGRPSAQSGDVLSAEQPQQWRARPGSQSPDALAWMPPGERMGLVRPGYRGPAFGTNGRDRYVSGAVRRPVPWEERDDYDEAVFQTLQPTGDARREGSPLPSAAAFSDRAMRLQEGRLVVFGDGHDVSTLGHCRPHCTCPRCWTPDLRWQLDSKDHAGQETVAYHNSLRPAFMRNAMAGTNQDKHMPWLESHSIFLFDHAAEAAPAALVEASAKEMTQAFGLRSDVSHLQRSQSADGRFTKLALNTDAAGRTKRIRAEGIRTSGSGIALPQPADEWTPPKPKAHADFSDGPSSFTERLAVRNNENIFKLEAAADLPMPMGKRVDGLLAPGSPASGSFPRSMSVDACLAAGISTNDVNGRTFRAKYGNSHMDNNQENSQSVDERSYSPPRHRRPADDSSVHFSHQRRASWLVRTDSPGFAREREERLQNEPGFARMCDQAEANRCAVEKECAINRMRLGAHNDSSHVASTLQWNE
eukprot:TRINITY_DN65119_c0_g2_i1.p1 TRINITY_DN65119_c0_g2~~TRINITY_DN65119_c0_g2_i1.p1  ORF type:complete len:1260 (-),score=189.73 TRINITY_DN65119_c0_g2_i1:76-3855(-)